MYLLLALQSYLKHYIKIIKRPTIRSYVFFLEILMEIRSEPILVIWLLVSVVTLYKSNLHSVMHIPLLLRDTPVDGVLPLHPLTFNRNLTNVFLFQIWSKPASQFLGRLVYNYGLLLSWICTALTQPEEEPQSTTLTWRSSINQSLIRHFKPNIISCLRLNTRNEANNY